MRRGEIWLCDFGEPTGHEPGAIRPALMVSADQTAEFDLPMVVPITRTRRGYPTHLEIELGGEVSYVQCELLTVSSGQCLVHRIGEVNPVDLVRVERVLRTLLKL